MFNAKLLLDLLNVNYLKQHYILMIEYDSIVLTRSTLAKHFKYENNDHGIIIYVTYSICNYLPTLT